MCWNGNLCNGCKYGEDVCGKSQSERGHSVHNVRHAGLLRSNQTWELQALGVVLGDAMISSIPGLAWWSVTDEFGTDPTLRYRETTLQFNALTIISKRIERGEIVNVKELANLTAEHVNKSAGQYK